MKQKHGDTEGNEEPNNNHDEPVDTFTKNNMQTFEKVLKNFGMEDHVERFRKEEVTIKDVLEMNQDDIK